MIDHMYIVYFVLFVISFFGSFLFMEELYLKRESHVSAVFVYVLVLMVGFTLILGVNLTGRYYTLGGDYCYTISWWWPLRWYVAGFGIIGIVGHMAYRRFFEK